MSRQASVLTRREWLLTGTGILATGAMAQAPSRGQRGALVVGINKYGGSIFSSLTNARNDAELVAKSCKRAGFNTQLAPDVGLAALREGVFTWIERYRDAEARFFYFAGHGTQYRGGNYLIPSDAKITSDTDTLGNALHVEALIETVAGLKTGVTVIVIDACRNVPKTTSRRGAGVAKPDQGMTAIKAVPKGCIVAYSTSPGQMSSDNPTAANGVYAPRLAANLAKDALPIDRALSRTMDEVRDDTQGKQIPWILSSLSGQFCFTESAKGSCGSAR